MYIYPNWSGGFQAAYLNKKIHMNGVNVRKRLHVLTELEARSALADRMNNLTVDGTWEVFKTLVH